MDRVRMSSVAWALVALAVSAGPVLAQSATGFSYQPRVPVSAFARPAGWLDPSRIHIATSVSVGTGFSGQSSGLQVTSLSYQFAKPAWLEVSLGNSFGNGGGDNGMFLEGLRFGFRPSANTSFQFQFRDVRSPLQYTNDPFGPYRW